MTAPLAGIRVLDLSDGDGAPFCAMQLGDAGADVIKVEELDGDWARPLGPPFDTADGPLFLGMNRNKRSIALDLDREEGLAVVRDLAASADILVESFPKAADAARMGLDYDTLSAANGGLIYCDLSLLGRLGPNADKPATDLIVQGISGVTRFAGERGTEPVRFGSNYAGVTASMYAMQAILAALYWRRQSGEGQYIETSYLMGMIATQQNYTTAFSDPDEVGSGGGFYTSHLEAPAHGYQTKDRAIEFTLGYARDPNALQVMLERVGALDEVRADPQIGDRPIGSEDLADGQALPLKGVPEPQQRGAAPAPRRAGRDVRPGARLRQHVPRRGHPRAGHAADPRSPDARRIPDRWPRVEALGYPG